MIRYYRCNMSIPTITKKRIISAAILLLILVPRLAVLQNGLDQQRMWDTNIPDAFKFLSALKGGSVLSFLSTAHKYPLLGTYIVAATIALHFVVALLFGVYSSSSTGFIRAVALNESSFVFSIRLVMLAISLGAIYCLYRLAHAFKNVLAPRFVLIFCGINFFVIIFSIAPRIHAFAFAGVALVWWYGFKLLYDKNPRALIFAFGAAALAGSVSPSALTAFGIPFLAYGFENSAGVWRWSLQRYRKISFWAILFAALAVTVGIGYPWLIASLLFHSTGGSFLNVVLSDEHETPKFALVNFFSFSYYYWLRFETTFLWILAALFASRLFNLRHRLSYNSPLAILALSQGVLFIIFFLSNVMTGRFTLAFAPSLILFSADVAARNFEKRWFRYPLYGTVALQILAVIVLTKIAIQPDTRSVAAAFVRQNTTPSSTVFMVMDYHLLGLAPSPSAVIKLPSAKWGTRDTLIVQNKWSNANSRMIEEWGGSGNKFVSLSTSTALIVVQEDLPTASSATEYLNKTNWHKTTFFPTASLSNDRANVAWDAPVPLKPWPVFFSLYKLNSFGPPIIVYTYR